MSGGSYPQTVCEFVTVVTLNHYRRLTFKHSY